MDKKQGIEECLNLIQTQRLSLVEATQDLMKYLHVTGSIIGSNRTWLRRLLRLLASDDIASLDKLLQCNEDIVVSIQKEVVYRHFEAASVLQKILLKKIAFKENADAVLAWRACMSIYITRTMSTYNLIFNVLEHGVDPITCPRKMAKGSFDTDECEASEYTYYENYENSRTDQWRASSSEGENSHDMLIEDSVSCTSILPEQCNAPPKPVIMDEVFFTAVAPKEFRRDEYSDVAVVMYEDAYRDIVDRIKANYDEQVIQRGSGAMNVAKQTTIRVTIESLEADICFDNTEETGIWIGKSLEFHFWVLIPEDFQKKQFKLTIRVFTNDIPFTTLTLFVKCNAASTQEIMPERRDIKSAFISYARADTEEVTTLIRGMEKVRPDLSLFMDQESLRSGQNWQEILKSEIERRDVLFLCWSPSAKESQWVDFEWRHMYNKRGIEYIDPIPLSSPQSCPPPQELEMLHFDDRWLRYRTQKIASDPISLQIRECDSGVITKFKQKRILIGREYLSDLQLTSQCISRHHMEIIAMNDGRYRVLDMQSTNGSYLAQTNERIPAEGVIVERGTKLRLGDKEIEIL